MEDITTLFFVVLVGMLSIEQRRVRPQAFAKELGISIRKLRELFTLDAPITKIQGLIWVNSARRSNEKAIDKD